jgi:hypothetical protein
MTYLVAIAAGSSKRIWLAADHYDSAGPDPVPVLASSTGGAFRPIKLPSFSAGRLIALAASGPSNAWLVAGNQAQTANLVFHWNGHKWKKMPVPTTSIGYFNTASISTTSASNTWLVSTVNASTTQHWNGHTWTEVPVPAGDIALGVAATATHTWIAGYNTASTPVQPVAFRLSGSAWKSMPIAPSSLGGYFEGVAAAGSTAYAAGERRGDAFGNTIPIIYRLHRHTATLMSSTAVPKSSELHTIAASTKLGIAGGDYETKGSCASPFHPLAETLDHGKWQQTKIPATLAPSSKSGPVSCG